MRLRVVYDNEAKEGLERDWGFSCLIESADRRLLFDTGASESILSRNMEKLGIQKDEIEIIVLSHEHWDHIGGLSAVLHPDAKVYLPGSFTAATKKEIKRNAADIIEVSGPADIIPGVHTTGELGAGIKEQSLVLDTGVGELVLTGCAHPGLDVIMDSAQLFGKLGGVMGGFHGFDRLELLRGLKMIIPCHCTVHKSEILDMYPEEAKKCEAGKIIEI